MLNVVIYGTGAIANYITEYIDPRKANIVAYADSYQYGTTIKGIKVISDREICNEVFDYIIIGFANVRKGLENLLGLGIKKDKIIAYTPMSDHEYYDRLQQMCNQNLRSYLQDDKLGEIFDLEQIRYHLCAMHTYKNYNEVVERDYVREQTLSLLAEEIIRKKVKGDVAELGVYKGEFSKKINRLFPDRTLYLFDTFEGFGGNDIKQDTTLLAENTELSKFKDTTEKSVLDSMLYPEKCIVKKGYFPETFDLHETTFAFVSIDVDLYQPIRTGLEIFYPLVEKGGYIMVHDYNSGGYKGVKKAVTEYCDANGISYVPLCDNCGSVVISK